VTFTLTPQASTPWCSSWRLVSTRHAYPVDVPHRSLSVNDVPVTAALSRSTVRLQGKPSSRRCTESPGALVRTGGWRVLFAHDFEAARAQAFYVGDPYTLALDVTDLVHASGANRLRITNTASRPWRGAAMRASIW